MKSYLPLYYETQSRKFYSRAFGIEAGVKIYRREEKTATKM